MERLDEEIRRLERVLAETGDETDALNLELTRHTRAKTEQALQERLALASPPRRAG